MIFFDEKILQVYRAGKSIHSADFSKPFPKDLFRNVRRDEWIPKKGTRRLLRQAASESVSMNMLHREEYV